MSDDDIHACGAGSSPARPKPRRARWTEVLGGALLLVTVLLGIGALVVWAASASLAGLSDVSAETITIVVDGHRWEVPQPQQVLAVVAGLGLAGGLALSAALLCLGLVVPLLLALVLLVLCGVIAAVLVAVAAALVLALSPLWLPLLLWLLLRPSRARLASSPA